MHKIDAKIIADSISPQGHRITSFILTYPRFIHSELMTHRMFSRNAASSRAIPFSKMVKSIEEDPFIPIAWQKDHKGMQGTEYVTDGLEIGNLRLYWKTCAEEATKNAISLSNKDVTKQLCNRLLEPFQWYTVLVTATEYDNFFELRSPRYYYEPEELYFKSRKDYLNKWDSCFNEGLNLSEEDWWKLSKSGAEIHIQALAEAMWDARNESTPKELQAGEWHIPFGDKIEGINFTFQDTSDNQWTVKYNRLLDGDSIAIKIATARCARLSYMTFDGEIDYEKDIKLHDQLLESGHFSPFEHCARAMSTDEYFEFAKGKLLVKDGYGDGDSLEQDLDNSTEGWCNNFRGFIPYRYLIENDS